MALSAVLRNKYQCLSACMLRAAKLCTGVSGRQSGALSVSLQLDVANQWKITGLVGQQNCGGCRFSAVRACSTQSSVKSSQLNGDSLNLSLEGNNLDIPLIWLRDHCRCNMCYNAETFQKNADVNLLTERTRTSATDVQIDGDSLAVRWADGHSSTYNLKWINRHFYRPSSQVERYLWDGPLMTSQPLPSVPFKQHMNSEDGLRQTLKNIIKYGFCVVEGAPGTAEGTRTVSERICFLLETVYDTMSIMTSGVLDHQDTAYTSLPLGAHTDCTYYTLPAGIQVFHLLEHDGQGGDTLLVDGFHAAEKLCQSDPSHFDCLVHTVVPHEYIEDKTTHLYSLGTVLSTDLHSGQVTHIRFNPYDRAPLSTVPAEDIPQFYASYDALTKIIRDKNSEFWLKLEPGMVLLIDNWRVMHGRSSFTGKRVLSGCYLPRDDWLSQARVFGLL